MQTTPMRRLSSVLFLTYVGIYCAVLFWFARADLYHQHFSTAGWMVVVENVCRALFIVYLFWIVQTAGRLALRPLAGSAVNELGLLARLTLEFFAGAGVSHIALLALGLLGLYTTPIAILLTLPLVALSYPALATTACRAYARITQHLRGRQRGLAGAIQLAGVVVIVFVVVTAAGLLLLVKGLYPAAGHDYSIHYFPYYQHVIAAHGIWPNDVWYHFYYSKGAGLFFLSMLLTDPLAPQLVTFCFFSASACALYLLVDRIYPRSLWPLISVTIYLGLYVFTPGTGNYRANGGWGEFEKLHELNTTLLIGIVWLSASAFEHSGRLRWTLTAATGLAIAASITANPTIGVYLGGVFGLLMVGALLLRDIRRAGVAFACAASAGGALATIFLINFLITGLINDQGILTLWPLSNIEKLHEWGALPKAIMVHWALTGASKFSTPLFPGSIYLLEHSLRLQFLYPMIVLGGAAAAMALALRRVRITAPAQSAVLFAMLITLSVLTFAAGRAQPVSFFRYASFSTPMVIALGVALFAALGWNRTAPTGRFLGTAMPIIALVLCAVATTSTYLPGAFRQVVGNAVRFAIGIYSVDTAYQRQDGWAGRLPWGGIYPGARGAFATVGPNVRIHTMHVHSYCMLPDCQLEIDDAFLTAGWQTIMFGSPEQARAAWQKAGVNYFLYSKELRIVDSVPLSPLFTPDNIARYLGIRWTDGTTALLTWAGPDTKPFDTTWLAAYRMAVAESGTVRGYPYDDMKKIFAQLSAEPHPWGRLELPWEWEIGQKAPPPEVVEAQRVTEGISVTSATYGDNCQAPPGNASKFVRDACNSKDFCQYAVKHEILGDPAGGCAKNFIAEYACAPSTAETRVELKAEAGFGSVLTMDCRPPGQSGAPPAGK